jgi:outer membrane protein assembly factor BamD
MTRSTRCAKGKLSLLPPQTVLPRALLLRALFFPVGAFSVMGPAAALPLLAACAGEQKEPLTRAEYYQEARQAFEEAESEFLAKDYEYAKQLMDDVTRNYGDTEYARRAQMRLADISYAQENFADAASEYKTYIHDHPNDPEVPYARFHAVRAQFAQIDNSFLQPPYEERDLAPAREAYSAARAFLADYPDYEAHDELRYIYESVSGMLVRHELYVARFYLKENHFSAAMRRAQYALRTYADSGLEPEAIVLLGEIYLQMKDQKKAVAMFRHVLAAYPDSAFVVPARRFLAHAETRKP